MAWNKTLPTDQTKIRLAPGQIRANWEAIETGNVPYDYLQLSEQATNPSQTDNTGWLYTKQGSSSGQSELFYRDDVSPTPNTIQLTSGGKMGTVNRSYLFENFSHNNTFFFDENNFISGWAVVTSGGALTLGNGLTSARNDVGDYTISFSTAATSANYGVVGTVTSALTRARVLYVVSKTVNNFVVRTQAINASAGVYEDAAFQVMVFGAR